MPEKGIVQAVRRAVRAVPGYPDLAVLDISCGDAEILKALQQAGCRAEGTHFREDDYILSKDRVIPEGIVLHRGVDITGPLPFPDGRYDVVLLTEVIEHLESHAGILHEISRILRPGGHLVLSTPNLQRLGSRWQFFLTGCHRLCQRRIGWDVPRERLYEHHISTPDFPVLHTLIGQAGLRIRRLWLTRVEFPQIFWMALYPVFWLATRMQVRGRAKYSEGRNLGERDLFRWMVHPCMLASKQLVLLAQKSPE